MLSDEHIKELYAYCERKSIVYYDLQVEIVDHVANAIEEKMSNNPSISFKEALEEVHRSFGIFGLRDMVEEKTSTMRKQYGKMRRKLFWSYFTMPKIIFTVFLVVVAISIERLLPEAFLPYTVLVIGPTMVFYIFRFEFAKRKYRKKRLKKLMMTDPQFFEYSFFPFYFMIQMVIRANEKGFLYIIDKEAVHIYDYYFVMLIFIIYTISMLVRKEMLVHVNDIAKKQYPAVFAQ